ncbi:MAG: pyridoxine 5'-phosphate synthase [bacterium]
MSVKLGVNIDHIATLRQARRETNPDPVDAARVCLGAGADIIVMHLRQDRRHIQDSDLERMRKEVKGHIHLEMACVPEMEKIALKVRPDSVCIVPESADEVTTRGGLKLTGGNARLKKTISRLNKSGIGVSLFVDADAYSIRTAHKLGADTVELCTTRFAESWGQKRQADELEKVKLAGFLVKELGMRLHAGHGLNFYNAPAVAAIDGMECLNIGYFIISRALFTGLKNAVSEMKRLIQ